MSEYDGITESLRRRKGLSRLVIAFGKWYSLQHFPNAITSLDNPFLLRSLSVIPSYSLISQVPTTTDTLPHMQLLPAKGVRTGTCESVGWPRSAYSMPLCV